MVIKWKNFKYSNVFKIGLVLALSICISLAIICFGFLSEFGYQDSESKDYFHTMKFYDDFVGLCVKVITNELVYRDENNIKEGNTISDDEKMEWEDRIEVEFSDLQYQERISNSYIRNEMEKRREEFIREKIYSDLNVYRNNLKDINKALNFTFILENKKTGEIVKNEISSYGRSIVRIEKEKAYTVGNEIRWIQALPHSIKYEDNIMEIKQQFNYFYLFRELDELLNNKDYNFYAAVKEPLQRGDVFYKGYTNHNIAKQYSLYVVVLFIITLTIGTFLFIVLLSILGKKEKEGPIHTMWIDKIPIEIQVILTGIWIALCIWIGILIVENYRYNLYPDANDFNEAFNKIFILGFGGGIILITTLCSLVRIIKSKSLLKYSVIAVIGRVGLEVIKRTIDRLFELKRLSVIPIFFIAGYIGFNIFLCAWLTYEPVSMIFIILFNGIVALYLMNGALKFKALCMKTEAIAGGDITHTVEIEGLPRYLKPMARAINNIRGGLEESVSTAIRSERMKTELIANVSHDLKTPLTSIISYVGLLKKEDLSREKMSNYVGILEEKSLRLKQLIEDLMEATKAATGNLPVEVGEVDLYQLIQQWTGEYSDKINEANINIILNCEENMPKIKADPRHVWRIAENLLGNTLKYSMKDSRVYVMIKKEQHYGVLIIKNISNHPLDIEPSELMQRFVRGEESRTTEGSGLGLSIAKSLAELQRGSLNIIIDGDLFKAEVRLPIE